MGTGCLVRIVVIDAAAMDAEGEQWYKFPPSFSAFKSELSHIGLFI